MVIDNSDSRLREFDQRELFAQCYEPDKYYPKKELAEAAKSKQQGGNKPPLL